MRTIRETLDALGGVARGNGRRFVAIVAAMATLGAVVGVSATAFAATNANGEKTTVSSDAVKQGVPATSAKVRAAVRASAENEPLDAPEHHKRIAKLENGAYRLFLDVKGAERSSTEAKRTPTDVVLVMDASGSMNKPADNTGNPESRWAVATRAAAQLADDLLKTNQASGDVPAATTADEIRISVVKFGTTADTMRFNGGQWTADADAVSSDSFGDYYQSNDGGTNWEAALEQANGLSTGRPGARKYIVFLSDGEPTFRQSAMGCSGSDFNNNDWYQGKCSGEDKFLYSHGVYGDGTNDNGDRNYSAAVNAGNSRAAGVQLFSVSTADEATEKMTQFAKDTNGSFFEGTDGAKLDEAFGQIVQTITTSARYQDVLISDALSDYVATAQRQNLNWYAVDAQGNPQEAVKGSMHADYDTATRTVTLRFDEGTKLNKDWTYTVSIDITPSDKAYKEYAANATYPNTGDDDTDADEDGNGTNSQGTSSLKAGFYSNVVDESYVQYKTVTTVNGKDTVSEDKYAPYRKPVVQVDVPTLTLVKSVNNANAGAYGAEPEAWTLSALKDNGAYGIDARTPAVHVASTDGTAAKAVAKTTLAPGKYQLSENVNDAYRQNGEPYRYYGGYKADAWTCAADEDNTPVTVTNGVLDLKAGAHVTCTVVNTAKPGAIVWNKVDANDAAKLLAGSAWTLSSDDVTGFAERDITDNGDNDRNDKAGAFATGGLAWGSYTLTETAAPAGYAKLTQPVDVTVLPAAESSQSDEFTVQAGVDGNIANMRAVSSLPLTGGTTGRQWLIGGGAALLGGGLAWAALGEYRRRRSTGSLNVLP